MARARPCGDGALIGVFARTWEEGVLLASTPPPTVVALPCCPVLMGLGWRLWHPITWCKRPLSPARCAGALRRSSPAPCYLLLYTPSGVYPLGEAKVSNSSTGCVREWGDLRPLLLFFLFCFAVLGMEPGALAGQVLNHGSILFFSPTPASSDSDFLRFSLSWLFGTPSIQSMPPRS